MATVIERGPRTDEAVHARRWWTLATLCLSLVIIVMDNTILNVAIPSLMEDLHATNSQIQWIIDAYTLVFAGLLLTSGSLGDRFGRKGALQLGIVLFGIGSVASAMAGSAAAPAAPSPSRAGWPGPGMAAAGAGRWTWTRRMVEATWPRMNWRSSS